MSRISKWERVRDWCTMRHVRWTICREHGHYMHPSIGHCLNCGKDKR